MNEILPILEETLRLVRYVRQCPPGSALDAAQLRSLFRGALGRMRKLGEQQSIDSRDLDEIGFALVALIDEVVLARGGSLAYEWMREQLQLSLFGENTAGETFFVKLDALRRDSTRARVLAVYYLALTLGFRGRYAVHGELALQELTDSVRLDLERFGVIRESALSPSGTRPRDAIAQRTEGWIVLGIGVAALLLACVFYTGVFVDLTYRIHPVLGG
ncbi:DotU family type IV/VI secretion system protein [Sandaracinus amylolyticus]|uniref:Putative transmembrane protein n=1 Tax=Sandaracinus amylolyticus TaxID=927083 RepID=A0A0F6YKF5_9BACT|nr:DotU family type IV/VI secretion system protein [Sandaracinus amylolyticus]AKF08820.1 Putative transmembrane protein [Sandaracinus amylolyticus]